MQVHRTITVSTWNDNRTLVRISDISSTCENSRSYSVLQGAFLSSIRYLVSHDYPRLLGTNLRRRTWAKNVLPTGQHHIFLFGGGCIPTMHLTCEEVIITLGGGVCLGLEASCPIGAIVSYNSLIGIVSQFPARDMPSYKRHNTQQSPK